LSENSDIGDDPKFNMAVRAKNVMWLTEPHSSVVLKQWSSLKYNIVWVTMWWSLTDYVVFVNDKQHNTIQSFNLQIKS
jgi:hypothetical protein